MEIIRSFEQNYGARNSCSNIDLLIENVFMASSL